MERLTTSALSIGTHGDEDTAAASRGAPGQTGACTPARGAAGKAHLRLASVRSWTHRLALSGELTHRSATALEAEIERLCEEGVTALVLDLRELTHIDPIGVAVIAFRCKLCKRRGCELTLVRGPRSIQRAFEREGLADSLPFSDAEPPATETPALLSAG
jgi:anti-anti-sigma factor